MSVFTLATSDCLMASDTGISHSSFVFLLASAAAHLHRIPLGLSFRRLPLGFSIRPQPLLLRHPHGCSYSLQQCLHRFLMATVAVSSLASPAFSSFVFCPSTTLFSWLQLQSAVLFLASASAHSLLPPRPITWLLFQS